MIRKLIFCLLLCISVSVFGEEEVYSYDDFEYTIDANDEVCITGYNGYDKDLIIPSEINGMKVTSIGDSAFYWCELLISIKIPNSIKSIGDSAFGQCSSLKSIEIPDSVISIGGGVFSECFSLENVMISEKNENFAIINNILYNKKEKSVISCFSNDSHITIPSGIKTIEISAFSGCLLLTSITIPNSVTSIEDSAFLWCESLTNITIPDSVKSIGNFTFARCVSFTNLTIPDSVTNIGDYAFNECTSLTNLTIPDSVMSIGKEAFDDCPSLTIQCNAGSYAEQYCKENNLKYFTTPDWLLD